MIRKYWMMHLVIIGLAGATLLFDIVPVMAQTVKSTTTLSISGNQTISHRFPVDIGDTMSVDYTVSSSNATTCVDVSVNFETSGGLSTSWDNRSTLRPYSQKSNGTRVSALGKGTVTATYSACPEVPSCKGKVSIDVAYSLDVAQFENYKQTATIYVPALVGLTIAVGFALFFIGRHKGKHSKPNTGLVFQPSTSMP